jgi:hypothetical protein
MGLIVLMFALQTVLNAINWYIVWLGFIYYANTPSEALDAFEVDGTTSLSLQIAGSMSNLLITMRLAIADSIMVSTHLSLPAKTANSLRLEGLEVLDYMQQELESHNCPSDV